MDDAVGIAEELFREVCATENIDPVEAALFPLRKALHLT
jgi:hypothetical protein